MRTRFPSSTSAAARFMVVVVFPTPPFWFVTAMILGPSGRERSATRHSLNAQNDGVRLCLAFNRFHVEIPFPLGRGEFFFPGGAFQKQGDPIFSQMTFGKPEKLGEIRECPCR